MCTLTVLRDSNRILMTMNRDEMRTRAPEIPPQVFEPENDPIAWMAPLDGKASGTWVGVNEYGLAACLLNQYPEDEDAPPPQPKEGAPSRGGIIPKVLAKCRTVHEAADWLEKQFNPKPYAGFRLILVGPDGGIQFTWNDEEKIYIKKSIENIWFMISSSSWNQGEVLPWRQEAYEKWRASGSSFIGELPAINALQINDYKEWTPVMERETTCTRSITQIEIHLTNHAIEMRYWPIHGAIPTDPQLRLKRAMASGDLSRSPNA